MIKQEFGSTAAAAKRVPKILKKYAAIANSYAAKLYGLKIIHQNIQDIEQNHTKVYCDF